MTDVWGDYQTASPRSSISQASNGMSSAASLVMSDINSSEVAHSQAPHPMGPSTAFTNLSSYIPPKNKVLFTTPSALARQMATRISRCLRLGTGCYIHVSGVTEAKLDEIDDAFQDLGIRNSVRFTYEHDLEAMVIRCMPSEVHERASRSFMIKLALKIAALPGHSEDSILPTTPKYTQHFEIDSSGDVSHAESQPDLIIPYKSVFDTGYGAGTDIVLTKAELSAWSLRVFRGLGR
ncbi:unnamed protein product [Tuber aestivum]|uniref:Uncharacterized protein n=1 Tax=Tuber aestivum TaxID=59557 RepID=A0A292PL99_9PEZI|nr:unnamed protein product [Tuber aestivum]